MRAWQWRGEPRLHATEREPLELRPGYARLVPLVNGLCATDLELLRGSLHGSRPPLVPGHEIVARVAEVDPGETMLQAGQTVVVDTMIGCGSCGACRSGATQLCRAGVELGLTADGGWQDELCVPVANCVHLPSEVDLVAAALIEPLTCELGLVRALGLQAEDDVLVVGSGVAALIFVQLVLREGAGSVTAVATDASRAERLALMGADEVVLLPGAEPPRARRFSCAIDAVGSSESVALAVDALAPGGRLALYGLAQRLVSLPLQETIFKNLTVTAHTSAPWLWNEAVELVAARRVELRSLVTNEVGFDELGRFIEGWVGGGGFSGAEVKAVIRHKSNGED